LVGTPKSQLRPPAAALLDPVDWHAVQDGWPVKRVPVGAGGPTERFVRCRSQARAAKEAARWRQKRDRLRAARTKIDAALQPRPTAQVEPVERRIGHWLGRYPAAAAILNVELKQDAAGRAGGLSVSEPSEKLQWAPPAHGADLRRTNHAASAPAPCWRGYLQLTHAEAAFRTAQRDLRLRPMCHQQTQRGEAHLLVCFLARALGRTLAQWLRAKGLGDGARQLVLERDAVRSRDGVRPTVEGPAVRLRVGARPEKRLAQLLAPLGLELPRAPKLREQRGIGGPNNGSPKTQVVAKQRSVSSD